MLLVIQVGTMMQMCDEGAKPLHRCGTELVVKYP
jgi:hypothetical protein